MRTSTLVFTACALSTMLSACTESPEPARGCSPQEQWSAGLERRLPDPACSEEAAKQAHLLGTELARLNAEFEEVDDQLRGAAESEAGALQRRQRQLHLDIDSLVAEARIQGWLPR